MKVYYDIKDMLERELEQIADKRELTSNNLEIMDKVVDIIKDIETICAMKGETGYSGNYPYYGYSYATRRENRDSMGRYSSDDGRKYNRGYSYNDSKNHIMSELDRMERETTDEAQKNMIRNWKSSLENA